MKEDMKECNLNENGYCICYLKRCYEIEDCAPKLIMERNLRVVKELIK